MKPTISAVVLTKNEEHNIRRCVESLQWVDEVVVVDDHSSDSTVKIARENGARVLTHSFCSFARQRNWALEHGDLRGDWVLMLDADENATESFAEEVTRRIVEADDSIAAYRTCRKTMMDESWLRFSDCFPVWIMRLVRRGRATFEDQGHGEVPVPQVDGRMGVIREPFIHHPFSRGMDDWWRRHTAYARREAERELAVVDRTALSGLFSIDSSRRRRCLRSISTSMPARGFLRFTYQYFLRGGFLDGLHGFRFCRMMACYESMIAIRKMELSKVDHIEEMFSPPVRHSSHV